jgi:hypothetical protein
MEVLPVRALFALALPVLCGCSLLEQLSVNAAPSLDPNKVYLGRSHVVATSYEVGRYACLNGPVLCNQSGVSFDCRCP